MKHRARYLLRRWPALVLVATLGIGLAAVLLNLRSVTLPAERSLLTQPAARQRFSERLTRNRLIERLASLQRDANWLLLGDLGPSVQQGEAGGFGAAGASSWLFLRAENLVYRDRDRNAALRASAMIHIAHRLAARHITLLIALVPDKSRIETAHLGPLRRPLELAPRMRDWAARLAAAHVAVLDLTPALAGAAPDAFLRTDTHWNETGSQRAAQALAIRLHAMHADLGPPVVSVLVAREHSAATGDLVRLAGIDGLPAALRPAPELVWHSVIETRNDSTDLFGDAGLPATVLLGTSFSKRSNFLPFLQLECQVLVADAALDGGDFSGAARRYFDSAAFRAHPPRTIVWEVPERTLQAPLDDDERAGIDALTAP